MAAAHDDASWNFAHGHLEVSANRHFLVHADGAPFFWLGDTAWELFHRLNLNEAELYLENRRAKGFTIIQAVCLAEHGGLVEPNAYGHTPLIENDPARPDVRAEGDYWSHVDAIILIAEQKGLYVGLLPTWGDKVTKGWGEGPEVFTPVNALAYGRFLGTRYRESPNIIWILGGDRNEEGKRLIWEAMADGLQDGDGGRKLIGYHPQGGSSSSSFFQDAPWLAFNMLQSGHSQRDEPNYRAIERDYHLEPVKPCVDGEPRYEDHPIGFNPENGWFDDYDVRQAAYWALFSGAFGHTYGCHDVWQFYSPGRAPISHTRTPWQEAVDLPGASQMIHARRLMLSRPFLSRIPDQSLIGSGQGEGAGHARATRSDDGSYAFIYLPTGRPVSADLARLSGMTTNAWWYDPRTGESTTIGRLATSGQRQFTPPSSGRGRDWVLVLDDASHYFPAPGTVDAE
ncbi:MAG TPA: glycoside hydrolase family 140 protein [Armatimonadota bacterium]|nr:glycoside hydrolase family 140 protein [Armatimonadota bacterium]